MSMEDKRNEALAEVKNRFVYKTDKTNYGRREYWKILKADKGPLEGDCEDFSLSVLWRACDKSALCMWWMVLTFQACIWHCRTDRGEGHAQLWLRGKWVYNIYPTWSSKSRHKLSFPYIGPLMAMKILLSRIF